MIKRIYEIKGFDCAHCAKESEEHLAKHEKIESINLDFASNKLYITYKDEELTIDEILSIIHEVESDEIELSFLNDKKEEEEEKVFGKEEIIVSIKLIFALIVSILCMTLLKGDSLYWVRFSLYLLTVLVLGYDVFYKSIHKITHLKNPLDENLLMSIAAIGAFVLASIKTAVDGEAIMLANDVFVLEEHLEAIFVLFLFQVGEMIEDIAVNKSKKAVMSAIDLRSEIAHLVLDEEIRNIDPEELKIDDIVLINANEIIPIDGDIVEGEAYIDMSSLTGEFVPVKAALGGQVFSGCLVKDGNIKIRANKRYSDSAASKIMHLITESNEKKTKTDKFITQFARWYTPIVCLIAILYTVISLSVGVIWSKAVYVGLEILVISCPCSIVISIPLAYFSGIGLASKNGIIIKGANNFDELVRIRKLVVDKTGTLTYGTFKIQKVYINKNSDEKELMESLYAAECLSNHPIAKAICNDVDLSKIASKVRDFKEIIGKGISVNYLNSDIIVGNYSLVKSYDNSIDEVKENGVICYVVKDNKYLGYVIVKDEVREDAKKMIDNLHNIDTKVILLTGDNSDNAKAIASSLNIDKFYSELSPEDKVNYLEKEMNNPKEGVAFLGDGVNDAPSISRSDVGFAMGGIGSDAAIENADVVIMKDNPNRVYDSIRIARKVRFTVIFNIVFSLFIKILVLVLAIVLKDALPMEIAVIADTGLLVLMVLSSVSLLYRKI